MGRLSQAIAQAIKEQHKTVQEAVDALSPHIPHSSMYNIITGSYLPRDAERIDDIAKYLGLDHRKLKACFAYDKTQQLLDKLSLDWNDITNEHPARAHTNLIPLYKMQETLLRIDENGRPKTNKKPSAYTCGYGTLGPHAYAVTIPDQRILPKADQGDIVIFDPSTRKPGNDEYALVRSRQTIYIGKIIKKEQTKVILITDNPTKLHKILKSDILFMHLATDIRKAP